MLYKFNGFEIDTLQFKLFCAGKTLAIEPKDFDLIVYLIKNRHRAVTRDEIFNAIWQGHVVCDSTLSNHIKSIRKILGDNGEDQNVISTIRGRGYQFIAQSVEILDKEAVVFPAKTRLKLIYLIVIIILLSLFVGFIYSNLNSPQSKKNSIAVLPFVNLSEDAEYEYFSDGISEEISNALSQVTGLHVISRSSSLHLQGLASDTPILAEQLGVTYILEGSVRKSETKIRITVQLIDAKHDRQIWGAVFHRDLVNILTMKTEISKAIVAALKNALDANHVDTIDSTAIEFRHFHLTI
jgi:TolB-like protein/DNA-binding winged helix-turn-helix (wHTH) protein